VTDRLEVWLVGQITERCVCWAVKHDGGAQFVRLFRLLHPCLLLQVDPELRADGYLRPVDQIIRTTDIPERLQLLGKSVFDVSALAAVAVPMHPGSCSAAHSCAVQQHLCTMLGSVHDTPASDEGPLQESCVCCTAASVVEVCVQCAAVEHVALCDVVELCFGYVASGSASGGRGSQRKGAGLSHR